MRLGIVVHGRFFAFDLARALIEKGHDVTLFTNYPKWAVRRFGIGKSHVSSFWAHGVISRGAARVCRTLHLSYPEAYHHSVFGRWAARQMRNNRFDAVFCFSGVAEEVFLALKGTKTARLLSRCSAHIDVQREILLAEQRRAGARIAIPSDWIVSRERREYGLADRIVVLSKFARESFSEKGEGAGRMATLLLGADLAQFRPPEEVIASRCDRVISGEPLRVLYTGAVSYRKGLIDLLDIARFAGPSFRFRTVGPVDVAALDLLSQSTAILEVRPKQPQGQLKESYAWADLYLFPTVEDGFPVVLAQAQASGLPILTTPNCSGPDIVVEGRTGWILPIRTPGAFLERLAWCDANRDAVVQMIRNVYQSYEVRDWAAVADDFVRLVEDVKS